MICSLPMGNTIFILCDWSVLQRLLLFVLYLLQFSNGVCWNLGAVMVLEKGKRHDILYFAYFGRGWING